MNRMRMKILTIIGARPQIIKAAAISRAIKNNHADQITEIIVHTGQHYDENMSQVFFDELEIPAPDHNLSVGSGSHGAQTAKMLEGIESLILSEKPNAVLVYGDTNSTVAGGLAAAKLHIPLIHIEAGLRSFNKSMPEEVNRIMCDHVSTLLFSPTKQGVENLEKEGFNLQNTVPYTADRPGVYHCGDIMYDNSLYFGKKAGTSFVDSLNLNGPFILATVHRPANTDDPEKLTSIFKAMNDISVQQDIQIVLPIHPRTKKLMETNLDPEVKRQVESNEKFRIIPPASFLEVVALEKNCDFVITDSGGVQKEAYFFQKPCLILRPQTEWVEIVANGNAILCDGDYDRIIQGFEQLHKQTQNLTYPQIFGDGKAAEFICQEIYNQLK